MRAADSRRSGQEQWLCQEQAGANLWCLNNKTNRKDPKKVPKTESEQESEKEVEISLFLCPVHKKQWFRSWLKDYSIVACGERFISFIFFTVYIFWFLKKKYLYILLFPWIIFTIHCSSWHKLPVVHIKDEEILKSISSLHSPQISYHTFLSCGFGILILSTDTKKVKLKHTITLSSVLFKKKKPVFVSISIDYDGDHNSL